jgi:hypothetical protein
LIADRLLAKAALWDAIAEGKRVLVLSISERDSGAVLNCARSLLPDDAPFDFRLTNGDKSITFPDGGSIKFRSVGQVIRSSLRGMSTDQVYMPSGAGREVHTEAEITLLHSKAGDLAEY